VTTTAKTAGEPYPAPALARPDRLAALCPEDKTRPGLAGALDADDYESPLMAQMVTTMTFLSPAIRRMSAGSLVMTEIRSADAD
jgi:hypothetical protein